MEENQSESATTQPRVINSENVSTAPHQESKDVTPKRPQNKSLVPLIALLFVIIIALACYILFTRQQSAPMSSSTVKTTVAKAVNPYANSVAIQNMFYTVSSLDYSTQTLYIQSLSGSASTVKLPDPIGTNNLVSSSEISGKTVIIGTNHTIYVSTDSGKNFKTALKLKSDAEGQDNTITSLKLSNDGKQIVFGVFQSTSDIGNVVQSINIDGSGLKTLFTSKKAGVYLNSYDSVKKTVVYAEGCFFCDGGPRQPQVMSLATNTISSLSLTTKDLDRLGSFAVNNDGTKLLYVIGVSDKSETYEGGIGPGFAPPYVVGEYDLASGQTTQLYRFEPRFEKDTNGLYKTYNLSVGYLKDLGTPYLKASDDFYTFKGATATKIFSMTDAQNVIYASSTQVVATTYPSDGSQKSTTSLYDIKSKQTKPLLQQEANVLGFTTN